MLEVEQVMGGFDSNFSYLVWDKDTKDAAILDASVDANRMLDLAKEKQLRVKFVFIMHSHFDYLVGVSEYKKRGIPLYGFQTLEGDADLRLQHQDAIQLGNTELRILHAPGHRFDCVLIHGDGKVFTTDVVFVGGCGRCDLEGSEPEKMYTSLYEVFGTLPKDTIVYPGHDYGDSPTSTVGRELEQNPYLTCKSKEEFLKTRMGM